MRGSEGQKRRLANRLTVRCDLWGVVGPAGDDIRASHEAEAGASDKHVEIDG